METEFILNRPDLNILLMIVIQIFHVTEENRVSRSLLELHLVIYQGEIRTFFLRFDVLEHYFNFELLCTFFDFLAGQLSIAMN